MISASISYHCLWEERLLCGQTLNVCNWCHYSSVQQKKEIKCLFTYDLDKFLVLTCINLTLEEAYRKLVDIRSRLGLWLRYRSNRSISFLITWCFSLFPVLFESQTLMPINRCLTNSPTETLLMYRYLHLVSPLLVTTQWITFLLKLCPLSIPNATCKLFRSLIPFSAKLKNRILKPWTVHD